MGREELLPSHNHQPTAAHLGGGGGGGGGGGAQWTNTGLDPQFSKFSGQEWTGTDEEGGMVRNSPKIKSRESSGKVPGKKKKKKKPGKKKKFWKKKKKKKKKK